MELQYEEIPWLFDIERNVSIGKKQDGENIFFKAYNQ